jgi:exopolysaccharide biosynthesis protein
VIVPALPDLVHPPAPFPLVIAQTHETEFVAPGVRRGVFRLQTSDGPLVVTVVAVDTHEPTVRFSSVLANDRVVSAGETVSSMAHRTDAVAGVNADYFDIGQTNQPLNLVVRDGALLRTPSKRVVLDVRPGNVVAFETVTFAGAVRYGATTVPLTSVNEWPPNGGVTFLTPAYGTLRADPTVQVAELVPDDFTASSSQISGTYRVAAVGPSGTNANGLPRTFVAGPLLGFGPAARAIAPLPSPGDAIRIDATTTPPLERLASAVGGGPLLVANGAPADDPNAPAPEERDRRFPVSGAALAAGDELLLVAVDGRAPAYSIGVTRPQFASLMIALGASSAMAFDSGGSATLVARVLGERNASVLNVPSDGEERAVGDGFFVYSDAPYGPPARLVARPAQIVALPNANVPVALALTDAAGHAVAAAREPRPVVVRSGNASRSVTLRVAGLRARVNVDVVTRLAHLDIAPDVRNPDPGERITFVASAVDARGRVVRLGDRVRWSSDRGRFAGGAAFVAPDRDARIVASVAGATASWLLRVGHHTAPLALFDPPHAPAWRFDAAPAGANGGVAVAPARSEMTLRYDFTSGERAAYANADAVLPGEPQSFAVDVFGDRSGVGIRAAFVNVLGERRALTLVRAVDWLGWRRLSVVLPDDLNPPVHLVSLYAVDSLANAPSRAAGSLVFRNASVVVAGSP